MSQEVNAIVIVGGGECGVHAALALRTKGFSGPITVIGDEPVEPYQRPPLTKRGLIEDGSAPQPIVASLDEHQIVVVTDETVTAVDRANKRVVLQAGGRIPFDRLLLATGAAPRRLAVEGGQDAHLLRTAADISRLQPTLTKGKQIVIAGGGFLGFEVAAAAVQRGCQVTVLELNEDAFARTMPKGAASRIIDRHVEAGVKVKCGVTVLRVEAMNDNSFVVVTNGGKEYDADVVVGAVGALPRTALAHAAGLKVDNGVVVNANLQTADASIFAAGDCCIMPHPLFDGLMLRFESTPCAIDQAGIAAANMLGGSEMYSAVPWSWSEQYDLSIQMAGLHYGVRNEVLRTHTDGTELRFGLTSANKLVSVAAVGSAELVGSEMNAARRLIGTQPSPDPAVLADPSTDLHSLLG